MTRPITPAALVKFRKRFKKERMDRINERIALSEHAAKTSEKEAETDKKDDNAHKDQQGPGHLQAEKAENETTTNADTEETKPNQGTWILDATCTPADIKYPTDLGLQTKSPSRGSDAERTHHR